MIPISPWVRKQCEPPEKRETLMGVDECEFPKPLESPIVDAQEEEEEVEEGRVPKTRRCPGSLSVEELRVHSLTHIPYHPGCRCCVAGRKRDHQHPRRAAPGVFVYETPRAAQDTGHARMQADLEAANGASIYAD